MIDRISAYGISRVVIALVWVYHGLVPKLLGPHADELAIWAALGFSRELAVPLSMSAGVIEILFGLIVLVLWRRAWPLMVTAAAMLGLLAVAAFAVPKLLAGAFNPVTTNLCVLALCAVALKLRQAEFA
ncbi:DoxX-like family protein [Dokdonella sp.]|uniref:DoxX-like family protein n=1 Tax=Dokdonella sp. TaxID=2291710 RepID=UPI0035292F12